MVSKATAVKPLSLSLYVCLDLYCLALSVSVRLDLSQPLSIWSSKLLSVSLDLHLSVAVSVGMCWFEQFLCPRLYLSFYMKKSCH